jgi:hypothetical protein
MDTDFGAFLEEFGQPTATITASTAEVDAYKGKLPNRLLGYWQRYGFCSFMDGLFSIVNPAAYESDLEAWIGDTPIEVEDAFHVIARSGFGDLLLWGARTGYRYRIKPIRGWIVQLDGDAAEIGSKGADSAIGGFFSSKTPKYFDEKDEAGKPLFARAVSKPVAPEPDEVFALEPAPRLGGSASVGSLVRRDVHVQLSVLAQLGGHELLDRQALTRKAFG